MSKVAVAGASGFIGARLCPELTGRGHEVSALTRSPENYTGRGTPVPGRRRPTRRPCDRRWRGCDAAYYLVHSLDDDDFERKDAEAAKAFGAAAADAGVQQIVYLGGLGADSDDLQRPPAQPPGGRGPARQPAGCPSPCCAPASWSATAASPGS